MAKFIMHWEVDASKTPEDPKERQQQWLAFDELVVQDIKTGKVKDWGIYAGEINGYTIFEGTEIEVQTFMSRWVPFVKFSVKSVLTIEQTIEAVKAMNE